MARSPASLRATPEPPWAIAGGISDSTWSAAKSVGHTSAGPITSACRMSEGAVNAKGASRAADAVGDIGAVEAASGASVGVAAAIGAGGSTDAAAAAGAVEQAAGPAFARGSSSTFTMRSK
eukprot:1024869-Karenia_brevis.AAC.2